MADDQSHVVDGHGPDPTHPPGPELRRFVDAIRSLNDQIARSDAPPAVLDELAAQAEAISKALEPHSPPYRGARHAGVAPDGDPNDYFPFSPVVGPCNPLAPPIEFTVEDGVVHGRGVMGAAYEGPPGCVHGGLIAEVFDELLGVANIAAGVPAMTGTLEIVYRRPTPLFTELVLVGRNDRVDGRKVYTSGTIHADGQLCAEASGIFIMVGTEVFDRLRGVGG